MKTIRVICLGFLMLSAGCVSWWGESPVDLSQFVGKWGSTGPQAVVIAISQLEVQPNGEFNITHLVFGEKKTEIEWSGRCRIDGNSLALQVLTSTERTEHELPFEIYGVLEEGFLIIHDDPEHPENTTKYRKVNANTH